MKYQKNFGRIGATRNKEKRIVLLSKSSSAVQNVDFQQMQSNNISCTYRRRYEVKKTINNITQL